MVKKLVQRELSFIVDSDIRSGALEKTADGSAFTIQLDQPIFIPSNAINPTLDIEESAVWYTTPNIYDDGPNQNNKFTFYYSRPRIQMDLEIPKGIYDVSQIEQQMNNAIIEGSGGEINTNAIQIIPDQSTGIIGIKVLYSNIYKILSNNNRLVIDFGTGSQNIAIASGNYTVEELVIVINQTIINGSNPITTDFITLKNQGIDGEDQSKLELEVIWTDTINFGRILFPTFSGIGETIGFINNNTLYYDYGNIYTSSIVNGNLFFPALNSLAPILGFPVQSGVLYSQFIQGSTLPLINAYNFYLLRMDVVDRGIRFNNNFSHIVEVILIDVEPGQQILTRPIHPPTSEIQHLVGRPINKIRIELLKDDLTPADTNGENYYARVAIKYWEPIEINL